MMSYFSEGTLFLLISFVAWLFPVILYREASVNPTIRKTIILIIFALPTMIIGSFIMALLFIYQENRSQDLQKRI